MSTTTQVVALNCCQLPVYITREDQGREMSKVEKEHVVYGLEDPRDNLYHYIGITTDMYRRFDEHVSGSGGNIEKNSWIFACRQAKVMICMREIERISTREEALQRERHWINHYLEAGHPLHNDEAKDVLSRPTYTMQYPLLEDISPKQESTPQKKRFMVLGAMRRIMEDERDTTFYHVYPLALILTAIVFFMWVVACVSIVAWMNTQWLWLFIVGLLTAGCGGAALATSFLYSESIKEARMERKGWYSNVKLYIKTPQQYMEIIGNEKEEVV